ncbi:hypothetical protein [Dyadobacter jiangsuensis]|uniref:Uncharacterized protein n=1 Tax=Dyadobacter jiangsuensis TaxID=1591085 RepID=A0A2P8FSV8_9BACT|nr:hypothetical protein [Dyadobacter jiangsuensis]PSL24796.1 hypothetical protein CLV60_113221 [Dyadobacter jiangsuensis]
MKLSKSDIITYAGLIFILVASFSNLLNSLSLRSVGKILQVGGAALYILAIVSFKRRDTKRQKVVTLTKWMLLYLTLRFIIDITLIQAWDPSLVVICYTQLLFIYFWIYCAFQTPDHILGTLLKFIEKIFLAGLVFAVIEYFIPFSLKYVIFSRLFGGSIPGNYYTRDVFSVNSLRLGSFYLSPLTFAFTCLFLFCYYQVGKRQPVKWGITAVVTLLAKTKTSLFGSLIFLLGNYAKYVNQVLIIASLVFIFALPIMYDGWTFYYGFDNTPFKSTANHISGLVFGIRSALEDPFWGNGLGTAGYVAYLETLASRISPSPFRTGEASLYQNGNESLLGVIGYQMGGIFLICHVLLFVLIFQMHMKRKNYVIASFILITILFQAFTESSFTILVSVCQAFLMAKSLSPVPKQSSGRGPVDTPVDSRVLESV